MVSESEFRSEICLIFSYCFWSGFMLMVVGPFLSFWLLNAIPFYYRATFSLLFDIQCMPQFSFSCREISLFKFVHMCRSFHSIPGNYEIGGMHILNWPTNPKLAILVYIPTKRELLFPFVFAISEYCDAF